MDTYLAIASKRDHRTYSDQAIDQQLITKIIDAGRVSGSGMNRQRWRFDVVTDAKDRERLSAATWTAHNLTSAPLVIVLSIWGSEMGAFDAGRAAQNMMLAAWDLGIASCPNGFSDAIHAVNLLNTAGDQKPFIAISFGYPARPRDPARYSPEQWIERANRKPVASVVADNDA
jgi:nitroreductase